MAIARRSGCSGVHSPSEFRPKSGRYRLPTESEWEYAARGGSQGVYVFGTDLSALNQYGWYQKNTAEAGEKYAHPVGLKDPNNWDLYDVYGNVSEWVQDWYGEYPGGKVTDPRGLGSGTHRVFLGGSWSDTSLGCLSSDRAKGNPAVKRNNLGFRLVREK